jgi:hypothetical protein
MVLVLAITIVGVMFFPIEAGASGSGIIIDGADYTSTMTNEYSGVLANVTSEVASRVSVEYGGFNSKLELNKSGELGEVAGAVSSRVVVEYADSASAYESKSSDALEQVATPVTSRIIVEYADFIFGVNLGPDPVEMIPEFPSPIILLMLMILSMLALAFVKRTRRNSVSARAMSP